MSLLNNYSVLNSSPGKAISGFSNSMSNYKPSSWYSFYDPDTSLARLNAKASWASGTQPPYAWILAPKGGELSSTTLISGTGGLSADVSLIFSLAATLAGVGALTASLELFTGLAATLAGSASIVANLTGIANLAASIVVNEGAATVATITRGVWSEPLPGTYNAGEAGQILGKKVLTTNNFIALK